jgi:hypothetical protein
VRRGPGLVDDATDRCPNEIGLFKQLAAFGNELMDVHLMRRASKPTIAQYRGSGTPRVEKVKYVEAEHAIQISADHGSYPVMKKFLDARRGRNLSLDEMNNVAKMADSIMFTIKQMKLIDVAYRSAF